MKKILIVIASMAIGVAANAASYAWGLSSYDYLGPAGEGDDGAGGHYYSGGTAFLYLGTVAYDNGFTGTDNLVAVGGWDDTYYGYGALSVDDASSLPTSDAVDAAGGQAYSIVFVDADVASLDDPSIQNYIILTGISGTNYDPGTEMTFAEFVNYDAVIGGDGVAWAPAAEPVPEPTSGLLLLLGMAGLALKRKRA